MNLATIVILLIVIGLCALSILHIKKNIVNGGCSLGCKNCNHCCQSK